VPSGLAVFPRSCLNSLTRRNDTPTFLGNLSVNAHTEPAWPAAIHRVFQQQGVRQVAYVPDAGHRRLIELCRADGSLRTVPLTTEEEGMALLAGAWLGGERGALLMQSSGVGNCINALASLTRACQFPLFMLVTMRGEWGEGNPWQIPMGRAVVPVLETMGARVVTVDRADDVEPTVAAMLSMSYTTSTLTAVLLSQRLLGAKAFQ